MFHNKIRLFGHTTVNLPHLGLASPTDHFILKSADGLGPTENDVFVGSTTRAGGYYQGRRSLSRESTFLVGLNPDWSTNMTAAELRDTIYGLLTSPVGSVNLEVMKIQFMATDVIVAETEGYLKRVEINPFTNEPQVQIVISSPDAYLGAPETSEFTGTALEDLEVTNAGSAPSGFRFEMEISESITEFTLSDTDPLLDVVGEQFVTFEDITLDLNDILVIDSRPGSRAAYFLNEGITKTNLLRKRVSGSSWIMLRPGVTHLYWTSPSLADSLLISIDPLYWGI